MKFFKTPFAVLTPIFIIGVLLGGVYHSNYAVAFTIVFLVSILFSLFKFAGQNALISGIVISIVLLGAGIMDSHRSYGESYAGEKASVIVEIEEAEVTDKPWKKAIGRITHLKTEQGLVSCSERVLFFAQTQLLEGDVIFLNSDFQSIENNNNPGEFNAKQYWNNKNIYKMAFIGESEFKFITHREVSHLRLFFKGIRTNLTQSLDSSLNPDEAGIAKALLLGDKSTLSIETKKSFSNAGAMHVLAVSGLHVGIIMYLLLFVISKFSKFISKRNAVIICVLLIWIYAGVTGFSPSVMRAAFMFSVLMIGQVWSRHTNSVNTLFFSAFVLLLINPLLIYDIGFQLSYLAVLGILLLYKPVCGLILIKNKWLRKLWEGTAVGISAQVLTVPLSLYYFHQFPNYFMISNVGVMLFAGVLLTIGVLLFTFKGIAILKPIFIFGLGFGISLLFFFIQFVESIPGSVARGFAPTVSVVLVMYGLIVLLWFARKNKRLFYIGASIVLILLTVIQWDRNARMKANEIVFFNLGSPMISVKIGNDITCFYIGKENDFKKVKFLMESYSKVKPGKVNYVKLEDGKTTMQSRLGEIKLTVVERDVYLEVKKKTYFLRSNYSLEERNVDLVIDLPYLAESENHYSLKKGAFMIEL